MNTRSHNQNIITQITSKIRLTCKLLNNEALFNNKN